MLVQWYEVPTGARLAKARRRKAAAVLVASGKALFRSAKTQTIKLKLTRAGKRLLEHATRLKLTATGTFTPRRGKRVSARKRFVLKRRF